MNVNEVGIILNGISILYKQYSFDKKLDKLSNDPELRNALLDAILNMSKVVLSQNIRTLKLKHYKIVVTSPYKDLSPESLNKTPNLIFYGIGDEKINVSLVLKLLEDIQNRFLKKYPNAHKKQTIDSSHFSDFLPVFDEILDDLTETPSQRFDHIF
jgi:hypothetical protein